jgi:hypothetical protein
MDNLKWHQAIYVAAGFSLACALATLGWYPKIIPLESLQRSDARAERVRPGPQFCGWQKPSRPIGHHPGAWVIELPLDGGVHCLVVNPTSEQQARRLANTSRETPLVALHTDDEVWQLEGPEGLLLSYEARVQEVRDSIPGHWMAQAVFLGIGIVLLSVGRVLQRRDRRARPEQSSAGAA